MAHPNVVSHTQLRRVFPKIHAEFVPAINEACAWYRINTRLRVAAFLAQTGHESTHFMRLEENLNYSADGLLRVFGKYFPNRELAEQYHRKPEMIANRVYANRMGNGSPGSGDGWAFRGRGAIQLTGRNNYELYAREMNMTVAAVQGFLVTPRGAMLSAGWFWNKAKLNDEADEGDIRTITRRINGGYNGLADRQRIYESLLRVL
jgi:putative chitinase